VLEREGWELDGDVPVVEIEAKDEKEAAEKLLVLSSTYGKIEPQGVYEFTEQYGIDLRDFDLPDLPDFDIDSFTAEFYEDLSGGNGDPEAVPEVQEEAISQTGDLWLMGDHRLLCGDSTKAEDVERVMDGGYGAIVSDPPYGISVDTSWLSALNVQR
jgi:hypothetical protein